MARLKPEQLATALQRQLSPIYILSGDESLLVYESGEKIRKAARHQGFTQHDIHHADANFRWDSLLMSANALSLFSDKKIIELRIPNGKPGDTGSKALMKYCEQLPEDTLLLVVLPKIDKRSESSTWFKALAEKGDAVTIWPIAAPQLPRWIEQRLAAAKLHASPEAIDILCSKIEGNLLAAVQEIEKLKLISDGDFIDAPTMASAVMDSARYNVFDLVDKALSGDARDAVSCLSGLRAEGNAAPVILWSLVNQVRTLLQIREACDSGLGFDQAATKARVWKNKTLLTRRALDRLPSAQLHTMLRKCARADKIIKGMLSGDEWNDILDLTLSLAGVEALSKRSQKRLLTH